MDLHEAIRELIYAKGPSIIFENNFIRELAKYGIFAGKPYLQEDLVRLINNGDLLIFKDKENWINDKNYYKTMIAPNYPFRVASICYILESIAIGLNSFYNTPQNNSKQLYYTKKEIYYKCICNPDCKYTAKKKKKLYKHAIDVHFPDKTSDWVKMNLNQLFAPTQDGIIMDTGTTQKDIKTKAHSKVNKYSTNQRLLFKKRIYSQDDLVNRGNNYDLNKGT